MAEPISVIIPTLNEARTIVQALTSAQTGHDVETIVVDGGSHDETVARARSMDTRVILSDPSRSRQMNRAADSTRGSILLFLHADTTLPAGFDQEVRRLAVQEGVAAGAFRLAINGSAVSLRLIEQMTNWRSILLRMPYGDQALFLRAQIFHDLGGFRDLPVMEDFDLVLRLRRIGKIVISPQSVLTSSRRWETMGPWKTTLLNQISIAAYYLGVSPNRIARWYYGSDTSREFETQNPKP